MSRSGIKKQPYRKSRRFDKTCRCNGCCGYCFSNRTIQEQRAKAAANDSLKDGT